MRGFFCRPSANGGPNFAILTVAEAEYAKLQDGSSSGGFFHIDTKVCSTQNGSRSPGAANPMESFWRFVMVAKRQLVSLRTLLLVVLSAPVLLSARSVRAQAETVLYTFDGVDGGGPTSGLTPDGAGNLYGTTSWGGLFAAGNVYKLSRNGSGGWNETVLYAFTGGEDGCNPSSGLVFDSAGNLYGTASSGGANGLGVVFELTPSPRTTGWEEKVLYSFSGGTGGANPTGGVIFDAEGNLYGTTDDWVDHAPQTVFELSPHDGGWTERTLYHNYLNGAGLTMDPAGNIFGLGLSTVFELSPDGKGDWNASVIHTFKGAPGDGRQPFGTLVFDEAGNLYGTTYAGGTNDDGTVYRLTRGKHGKWSERVLHSFAGGNDDGSNPFSGVVLDAAGNMFGCTTAGGSIWGGGAGTVFELAPVGRGEYEEKILWDFDVTDGGFPRGTLILDLAGNLYGTALAGSKGAGIVFKLTP